MIYLFKELWLNWNLLCIFLFGICFASSYLEFASHLPVWNLLRIFLSGICFASSCLEFASHLPNSGINSLVSLRSLIPRVGAFKKRNFLNFRYFKLIRFLRNLLSFQDFSVSLFLQNLWQKQKCVFNSKRVWVSAPLLLLEIP